MSGHEQHEGWAAATLWLDGWASAARRLDDYNAASGWRQRCRLRLETDVLVRLETDVLGHDP
jgi:hypothetical protein